MDIREPCEALADPCDPCDPCAYKTKKDPREKIFGLLLPFGQWAYGESRVQKNNSWSKKICVLRQ